MLRHSWSCVRYAAAVWFLLLASDAAQAQSSIALQPVASGLASPVAMANAGDGSARLFIVEQAGTIRILSGGQVLATPFLNITAKVLSGGERGLLGLAFDPAYASNGFFYVFYTSQPAGQVTIARYHASGNTADPQSELILKTQPHAAFGNHNGGALAFGPDGCLYAGIGDGGSGGDPDNNGQNLATLLGKIIRISKTDGTPCTAGTTNPFVGTSGARGEIWALGVRNPWRITFDRQTGDLFIADVGQGAREEVNFQPPGVGGRNYCWRNKEGTAIFDGTVACAAGIPTDPILEYTHAGGNCSITGGYRYRGSQFSSLVGTYFYGDFCTGIIWGARQNGSAWTTTQLLDTTLSISTFGEDEAGEIYVADLAAGAIHRLIATNTLQVSPATNVALAGSPGGPFSPATFVYSLSAASGSINYSISIQFDPGVPNWLTVTPASGTVTTSATNATFGINTAANGLAAGTYHATITFTNTSSGGSTGRTATLTITAPLPDAPTCRMASGLSDFGGDGRSDLLFRRTDGQLTLYQMNGLQIASNQAIGAIGVDWTLTAAADFNGDGKADMLFRRNDGTLFLYLMNGPQIVAAQALGAIGTDWEFVGAEDFDGDGRADMMFRRTSDGMLALYLMNGFQVVGAQLLGSVGTDWRVRGVRDFNGDGRADLLFRRNDGMLALYLMNGFQVVAAQLIGAVGTDWDLQGVRDFNGDGKADMLFRRSDGTVSLYLMDGFRILAAQVLGAIGPDFSLLGLGDLNGDGRGDMVFRRASDGMLAGYLMNGFQIVAAQLLGAVGTDWGGCYSQPPAAVSQFGGP